MSLWRRLRAFVANATHAALDRAEDPRDVLEGAYRRHLASLQDARRGVADVLTSEKRLELEAQTLRATAERAMLAASEAARGGDDETARRALRREAIAVDAGERLDAEIAGVRAQRLALETLADRLRERVERFRIEKLALGARYATARAAQRAGADVLGISSDMTDVAGDVERARDASLQAQARAAALAELATGTVPGDSALDDARIDARLRSIKAAPVPRLTTDERGR